MTDRDDYRGDVWYDEWRAGLPEGSISDDRIEDGYYNGVSPESLVQHARQEQADRRAAEQAEEYSQQQEGEDRARHYDHYDQQEGRRGIQ